MRAVQWGTRALALLAATALQLSWHPVLFNAHAAAQTERSYTFDIPSKSIRRAINDIAASTGINVVFAEGIAVNANGNAVRGTMSVQQALDALLKGSGLVFRFTNPNTVSITDARAAAAAATVGDPADGAVLDTVLVQAAKGFTEGTGRYTIDEMATATGLPLAQRDTPQSTSVVSNQQLKDQGTTTIQDALKKTTGVNVIRDSGAYRFLSRGFYMDQIQEDGINSFVPGAQINPYRSGPGPTDIDIYDHVEVLRGPSGLVQGTGEPGGTVNLVRKRPTDAFQASSTTTLGSWDKYRETVDVSGSLNDEKTVRGRIIGIGEKAGSFKDNVESANGTIYGVLEADLGENTTATLGGLYQKKSETPDYYGLPLSTTGAPLALDRSTYLGAAWNDLDTQKENVFAEVSHDLSDDWKLDLKANYTHFTSETAFAGLTRSAGVASNGLANVNNMLRYDNDGNQYGLQAQLTGKYDLLGHEHDLFAGLSYTRGDFDSRYRRLRNSTSYNVYTFTGNEIAEPDWNSNIYDDLRYNYKLAETAFNFGTRYNLLDDLHLVAGARLTRFDYESTTHYITYAGAADGEIVNSAMQRTKLIPYFGLTYDVAPDLTLYASYTDIFKPQSSVDVNGNMLPPVMGENYEIGVKTALLDDRINASFAIFQINQKNRAIYDAMVDAYYAEGAVRSRGFELELSGEVTTGLNLFAGYTFNRSKYLETESTTYGAGTFFSPHTPVHMLRLHATYILPFQDGKWTIGGGVQAQSSTRSISAIEQGGYALWDASLKYDINETTSLQLVANNLFDKRYFENNRTRTVGLNNFYGDPRNFTLTLTKKF